MATNERQLASETSESSEERLTDINQEEETNNRNSLKNKELINQSFKLQNNLLETNYNVIK